MLKTTKKNQNTYRQDAYKIIVGLMDLYMREGNPSPETVSELTGHEYTFKMCDDLSDCLWELRERLAKRRG